MKTIRSLILPFVAIVLASSVFAQTAAAPVKPAVVPGRKSPHETVSAFIGGRPLGHLVTVTYGRPYTKDPKTGEPRKIWGGLVKWDKADRLGADEATLLLTHSPLVVGATTIPAGAYTLYLVPSESGTSRLALSTHIGKWGVPVDETHDLVRLDLKKESLATPVDQLTIVVENETSTGGGILRIRWESTEYSLSFTVAK